MSARCSPAWLALRSAGKYRGDPMEPPLMLACVQQSLEGWSVEAGNLLLRP